jgi:hypothetical protein
MQWLPQAAAWCRTAAQRHPNTPPPTPTPHPPPKGEENPEIYLTLLSVLYEGDEP